MSKHIIKKKQLPVAQIKELFSQLKQYLPQWLRSPTLLVTFLLNAFNNVTTVFCYLILIGQTARLLANEQTYANTKVLMTKWMIFLFFELIFSHVSKDSIQGSLLKSFFLLAVMGLIYPSNVSKTIFQKYFKGQQTLKESSPMTDSFMMNNNSLLEKFIVVILVHWLKAIKYVLRFVNPSHIKTIQEEVKEINLILSEEKYFWKGDNNEDGKSHNKPEFKVPLKIMTTQTVSQPSIPQISVNKTTPPAKLPPESGMGFQEMIQRQLTKEMMQVMDMEKQNYKEVSTVQEVKGSNLANTTFSGVKNQVTQPSLPIQTPQQSPLNQSSTLSKQRKYKKYGVSEYLPIFSSTDKSNSYSNIPNKRCTYYREIEMSYDINSAVIIVTSLEDMKVSYYSLEEIAMLQDLMVQFEFEQNQQMMVKFKNRNEFEEFISSIDMYESSLHNK